MKREMWIALAFLWWLVVIGGVVFIYPVWVYNHSTIRELQVMSDYCQDNPGLNTYKQQYLNQLASVKQDWAEYRKSDTYSFPDLAIPDQLPALQKVCAEVIVINQTVKPKLLGYDPELATQSNEKHFEIDHLVSTPMRMYGEAQYAVETTSKTKVYLENVRPTVAAKIANARDMVEAEKNLNAADEKYRQCVAKLAEGEWQTATVLCQDAQSEAKGAWYNASADVR